MPIIDRPFLAACGMLAVCLLPLPLKAADSLPAGADLVRTYCSGCHQKSGDGFARISAMRKTPEGWVMTLVRMRQVHGLVLNDEVRDAIVRYLSDAQGLAPEESAPGRFALERQPNAQDLDLGPEINVMCGRCHSLARVSLQHRDEEEWRKLSHTHVGQWPSLEYQASGRDRHWWEIANGPLPAKLAALYPLKTPAWSAWLERPKADLSGAWVVVGRVPGGRDFYGTAQITKSAGGDYEASYQLKDIEGSDFAGSSKAVLYTGYEWRGSAQFQDRMRREVFHVSEDGSRISGRWFDADHNEDGGEWTAVRESASAQILAVWPKSLRIGSHAPLTVVGVGLSQGDLGLGEGLAVSGVKRDAHVIHADIAAATGATPGQRHLSLGGASGDLVLYSHVDALEVTPKYGIARLGGGRVDPVTAQFEAVGTTRLANGEVLSLGPLGVDWATAPFNAEAKRTEDEKYAGYIDRRGRFLPSAAGPNPAREFSGDNVGDLAVIATLKEGDRALTGKSHLIVTVQRWITPPIY